jgi:hypothetical protein
MVSPLPWWPRMSTDKFNTVVATFGPRFQRDLGLKGFQVDGIFGNLGHESRGMTALHEEGQAANKGGIGWNQATGPRRRQFEAFAATLGLPVQDDEANYRFIVHELETTESASLAALKATRSRDQATSVFMQKNERPGVPALESRIKWAKLAEAARLNQEKANVSLFNNPAPVAPPVAPAAPLGAPVAAVAGPVAVAEALAPAALEAHNPDQLLAAIEALYVKLLDFLATTAVSKGVPAPAVSVARMLINQVDVPKYAVNYLLKLAAK